MDDRTFFTKLAEALDTMEEKRLGSGVYYNRETNQYCALGVYLQAHGVSVEDPAIRKAYDQLKDPPDYDTWQDVYIVNDRQYDPVAHTEAPEDRWARVRGWVKTKA